MASLIDTINWNDQIVDPKTGYPTPFFQRLLQKLALGAPFEQNSNGEIGVGENGITNAMLATMAAKTIKGRKTNSVGAPEDCTLSEILDFIGSAAQGDILYRGSSGWARLGAGTSGHYLKTNGTGASPAWAAVSAGGAGYEAGPATPPTAAGLATWDNQGTSTWTDGTGVAILSPQVNDGLHGRITAAPSAPYDVYCRVDLQYLSTAANTSSLYLSAGIMFKDTAGDNERLTFGIQMERIAGDEQHLWSPIITRWTGASPPVLSAQPVRRESEPFNWLRVNVGATGTLTFYVSMDGKNWLQVATETLAAFIDGAASYGVNARANSNCTEAFALFSYFSTTAPA